MKSGLRGVKLESRDLTSRRELFNPIYGCTGILPAEDAFKMKPPSKKPLPGRDAIRPANFLPWAFALGVTALFYYASKHLDRPRRAQLKLVKNTPDGNYDPSQLKSKNDLGYL